MPQKPSRTARIEGRIAPDALLIVKRAAELQGRSVSDFVIDSALTMAQKAIEETHIVRLAVEDQRGIAESILHPPPLTASMERAIGRYKRLIKTSR
ncbi:MAG: hypothetical protein JWM91_3199 [Rhodospirillales bacterium]|nr:hypothetical protein [Rhodospirillales bacterium]